MLRDRCGSNYCLFRDVVTRRDHMTRVFCDRTLPRNERIVHVELLVLSDKIVADKFWNIIKEIHNISFDLESWTYAIFESEFELVCLIAKCCVI